MSILAALSTAAVVTSLLASPPASTPLTVTNSTTMTNSTSTTVDSILTLRPGLTPMLHSISRSWTRPR